MGICFWVACQVRGAAIVDFAFHGSVAYDFHYSVALVHNSILHAGQKLQQFPIPNPEYIVIWEYVAGILSWIQELGPQMLL